MASQSLYRKWRSQTFGDLVGQEPVIRTLKNALNTSKLAHAYLFTGPRGTGKTSTARLLAKTINCLNPQNGEPCNICDQCREITAGSSFNVIEIDAASNRGIDSIRELREKVMMPPTTGKYKVYILDEAHMLTVEAFNALLKTLEEPPPHAIFVMATTDVQKMLPTVLSRCQRFDFKRITTRQIVAHLNFVASEEGVKLDRGAAELIARAASGGMRDALSLLDQAIAYSGQEIALSQVQTMLGVADPRAIQHFITHIARMDSPSGLHLIHELAEAGADLRQVNTQVAEYWRAMMLAKAGADIAAILDHTQDETNEIIETARLFRLEELTECARTFAQNELVQKSQGTPQLGLELAFLTCVELHRRAQSGQPSAVDAPPAVKVQPRPTATQDRPHPQAPATPHSSPQAVLTQHPTAEAHTPPPAAPRQSQPAPESTPPAVVTVETRPVPQLEIDVEPPEEEVVLPEWDDVTYVEHEETLEEIALSSSAPQQAAGEDTPSLLSEETVREVQVTHPPMPVEEPVSAAPSLTIEQVKERWEYIKRRVKTKKDGAKIAAVLNGYAITGIEGEGATPVVLIRANAAFHYSSLQKSDHQEAIEWAMKIELGTECRVRLLPPGQSVPLPPASRSANSTIAISPYQSAYRERPQPPEPPVEPPPPVPAKLPPSPSPRSGPSAARTPQKREATASVVPAVEAQRPSPLARNAVVSENTSSAPPVQGETRQAYLEKKAKGDQVVQEVVRIFKAEIKTIQPK